MNRMFRTEVISSCSPLIEGGLHGMARRGDWIRKEGRKEGRKQDGTQG